MAHLPRAHADRVVTDVRKAADVTEEILELATQINDEWFGDESRVSWGAFWDRLDGSILKDGSIIDLGDQFGTDAMKKIKAHVKLMRRSEY